MWVDPDAAGTVSQILRIFHQSGSFRFNLFILISIALSKRFEEGILLGVYHYRVYYYTMHLSKMHWRDVFNYSLNYKKTLRNIFKVPKLNSTQRSVNYKSGVSYIRLKKQ